MSKSPHTKESLLALTKENKGGCWEWQAGKDKDGYGQVCYGKRAYRTHRLFYELYKDKIPKGICVLHKCDNPSCVNPKHLWLGTNAENTRDRDKKKRGCCGEKHHRAKMTERMVVRARRIKEKSKTKYWGLTRLARQFGVTKATLFKAVSKTHIRSWKNAEVSA